MDELMNVVLFSFFWQINLVRLFSLNIFKAVCAPYRICQDSIFVKALANTYKYITIVKLVSFNFSELMAVNDIWWLWSFNRFN